MRYFFHVVDGTKYLDPLGREFASDEAAIQEGRGVAALFAKTNPPEKVEHALVIITNLKGQLVATLRCSDFAT